MNEDQVKRLTQDWLRKNGYVVKQEVGVLGTNREVILDFYAYRDKNGDPEIIWVEAKGDVNLSELLEGFIRLEFAVWRGGGLGILSIPHKATLKLLKYRQFLRQAENTLALLDVETQKLIKLNKANPNTQTA